MKKFLNFITKNIMKDTKTMSAIIIAMVLIVAAVLVMFIGESVPNVKTISIVKDDNLITLALSDEDSNKTVAEVLTEAGVEITSNDVLNCKLCDNASSLDVIVITCAGISDIKNASHIDTLIEFPKEEEVLREIEEKEIETKEEEPHQPEIYIDYEDIDEVIPYETVYKYDETMKKGSVRIEEGTNGVRTYVYELKFVDGELVSRRLEVIKIKKQPVSKIVYEGTIDTEKISDTVTIEFSKVLKCSATAYTNDEKWGNRIAFSYLCGGGLKTRWGIIATDPSVIPAGTLVYVKCLDQGFDDYGYAIAADTGKSIKNYKIDVWMDNDDTCNIWGIRNTEVYVLEDQTVDIFALRGDAVWTPPKW